MSGKLRIGIIGCGDFLRLRAADLLSSRQVEVKLLYSPVNSANAERYAEIFGAKAADSPEAIINDPEIDVVCVFVPPFVRKEYVLAAAKAGKQIVATKPLAADLSDAREMTEAVEQAGVRCGVIYRREPIIRLLKLIKKYFQEENSVSWRFTSRIGSTTILRGTAGPRPPKKMVAHSWTLCCII